MNIDKTKRKNWLDGDTFAVKIKDYSEEYNGRYLILIKTSYDDKREYKDTLYFRVKITKNNVLPTTEEELNKLEYIITGNIPYIERLLPLRGLETLKEAIKRVDSENTFYKDEYGYLNEYKMALVMKRGIEYSNFIYLGNFDLISPKDEYVSDDVWYYYLDKNKDYPEIYYINKLLINYEDNNLKKGYRYTKKGNEKILRSDQENIEMLFSFNEYMIKHEDEIENNFNFINGWGPKLYDSDVALDIKADYKVFLNKSKKNNQSNEEMIKELCDYYEDYINDSIDGPLFWIILADLQMKNKLLTKEQKEKALEAIEKDLDNWKDKEKYQERENVLNSLKVKLENYINEQ